MPEFQDVDRSGKTGRKGNMAKRVDPHTRLFVFALIFNALTWSAIHENGWSAIALISYVAGFSIGWTIHPFFIPKRDQWTKSAYDRLSVRLLRSLMVAGLTAFFILTLWMALDK
jgi:hypothetical protein